MRIMPDHRKCKYYQNIPGTRRGYCRNERAHYYGLMVQGGGKGADRCFVKKQEEKKHDNKGA